MQDTSTIRRLAQELAEREGFELVDVVRAAGERRTAIRVFIHRLGGVTLDDCRRFSETLGALLEVENAIRGAYTLEVSSPGITRPLATAADFERNLGQRIRLAFTSPGGDPGEATGVLRAIEGGEVLLETDRETLRVALSAVRHAQPLIDWQELFRAAKKRSHPEEPST